MEHKMIATRVSALALAAVLGVAAAASAQTPPPQRQPGSMGYPAWTPGSEHRRGEREAAHLKALHDALNIRPDQEQAFQAYAASMRPAENGERPGGMAAQRLQLASMTTPERVDAMGRMMDERMQRMRERFQRHAAAVKALYAALGPEQRRTLDALPGLMGRGMGMGMGHGMGKDRGSMDRPRMGPPPAQPQ
jgi:periplasmic protein CpxP/Spy